MKAAQVQPFVTRLMFDPNSPGEVPEVKEVLCSQRKQVTGYFFALVKLAAGDVVAVWENHFARFATLDEMKAAKVLNLHELQLLEYKGHA